ncbi:MAG: endonuclease [Alphaproteobacteria bacterium]|nr:endonuclease [Alphaproteobacteria bacterium]
MLNSLLGRGGLNCESPLYFETEYQIFLFKKELKKLFLLWHQMYPLSSFECERNRKSAKIQGNFNHFTKESCEIYNI